MWVAKDIHQIVYMQIIRCYCFCWKFSLQFTSWDKGSQDKLLFSGQLLDGSQIELEIRTNNQGEMWVYIFFFINEYLSYLYYLIVVFLIEYSNLFPLISAVQSVLPCILSIRAMEFSCLAKRRRKFKWIRRWQIFIKFRKKMHKFVWT